MKCLSELLRGVTSNHKENLYCLNCFHSYTTENKLEKHYNVCKTYIYIYICIYIYDLYIYIKFISLI